MEEDAFAREFRERDFGSEAEMLNFLHKEAEQFGKEFATIYGVSRNGKIIKAMGEFGVSNAVFVLCER
jgi:hypothetical protein